MNWILQSLVAFLLDFITSALDVISKEFYTMLSLSGENTLDLFLNYLCPILQAEILRMYGLYVLL